MARTPALFVARSVVLELEWVMRGFYRFAPAPIADALNLAASTACTEMLTFPRCRLSVRANRLGIAPACKALQPTSYGLRPPHAAELKRSAPR
jgi:hypothetical protein